MPEFSRLLVFRALRPDRLTAAMARFVAASIGAHYTTSQAFDLERSFQARPRARAGWGRDGLPGLWGCLALPAWCD